MTVKMPMLGPMPNESVRTVARERNGFFRRSRHPYRTSWRVSSSQAHGRALRTACFTSGTRQSFPSAVARAASALSSRAMPSLTSLSRW
ncbi:MAG: hypothetical protein ABI647_16590 [Gemmatimonadota bacterium]